MTERNQVMAAQHKCALCAVDYWPKEESHILPSFVYKWQKATSATGFLRYGRQINLRTQDGLKEYFLCESCEDLLGKHESKFAATIFHPYMANDSHVTIYDENILKFGVGLAWRTLAFMNEKTGLKHFRGRHPQAVEQALKIWSDYLLGANTDIGKHEIHWLPLGGIVHHTLSDVPDNINRYVRRTTEIDVAVADSGASTYSKCGPIIFIGLIEEHDPSGWKGTKIHQSGTFGPGTFQVPPTFQGYLFSRCERLKQLEAGMSENQLAKIASSYQKNEKRAEKSDTLNSTLLDIRLRRGGDKDH